MIDIRTTDSGSLKYKSADGEALEVYPCGHFSVRVSNLVIVTSLEKSKGEEIDLQVRVEGKASLTARSISVIGLGKVCTTPAVA